MDTKKELAWLMNDIYWDLERVELDIFVLSKKLKVIRHAIIERVEVIRNEKERTEERRETEGKEEMPDLRKGISE